MALAANAEKFHDGSGEAYARIDQDGHREVWRIGSKAFKYWLQRKFWMVMGTAPNAQALQDAIGVLPLPTPIRGGSLDELRELINVSADTDWMLIIAWLVAALRPRGPYPVLSINGEQGSAKSTLCRILRGLIDPNVAALRSAPRDERDLVIAGSNGHFVALENLSKIQDWLTSRAHWNSRPVNVL